MRRSTTYRSASATVKSCSNAGGSSDRSRVGGMDRAPDISEKLCTDRDSATTLAGASARALRWTPSFRFDGRETRFREVFLRADGVRLDEPRPQLIVDGLDGGQAKR